MFYSHQLLARKASLGQIWMAATMHAKINRRKLDKLNIIKICEEILNPSVPMALRLSGILMGGVVIVYERKVKLLYDDVTRLLAEINEAWKVKSAPSDPTRLPKGKSQAKYEAVTLPPNRCEDLGDIEQSLPFSSATFMDFQQTSYIAMRLDSVDESYLNLDLQRDLKDDHHQADPANITLVDTYDAYQDAAAFNHFERFDIEGDEETQLHFTPPEHSEIPTFIHSPPRPEDPHETQVIHERHPEEQVKQQSDESKEANLDILRPRVARKRAKKPAAPTMDYDQTIIPGPIYQSWLQDSSDIVSKRGKKQKPIDALSMMKTATLLDLPSVVLVEKLVTNGNKQVYYPAPLLEVWLRSTQPHDSPSGRTSIPRPPEPSWSSPLERMNFMEPMGDPPEDFHVRVPSQSKAISIEKQMGNSNSNEMPPEILMDELRNNLKNNGWGTKEANGVSASKANLMTTPGNSGDEIRSIPSSGSGHGFFSHNSEVNPGRSGKKRPFSASKTSGNGLEPVAEEHSWQHPDPNFKLPKLSEDELTPGNDLLVETGPTQTQTQNHQIMNQPLDQITNSIRMHLKTHFETPGSAQVESLNQLAVGMNKKQAACFFYQTCVLATRDDIKVDQSVPYGDILISRGAKM